jgi:signal transduction histidine kinase
MRNALDALLENAVRYTERGGLIRLSSHAVGGSLTIEVADGGPGIPSDALDRIFDRFARGDAARTRTEGGVGLGLAIVDAIARAHGGRCTATSSAAGAVFSLSLPGFVVSRPPGTEAESLRDRRARAARAGDPSAAHPA